MSLMGRALPLCLKTSMVPPDTYLSKYRAFSSNFGKRPLAEIGKKMIDLTSKLGEINDIEHIKGSKIYPQNQVILFSVMNYDVSLSLWLF